MRVWIAVFTGSSRICTAIAAWLLGGGAWAVVGKLLLVLVAAGVLKGMPWTTNAALLAALVWLAVAVVLGLREEVTVTVSSRGKSALSEVSPEAAEQAPALTRDRLVQALHEVGAPHAHTSALAEHLKAPAEAVREALDEAGITRSGGVRMKGRKVAVSPGVKRAHFPPLPSPAEEAAQEGALTSNNNSNNTGQEEPGEGSTIVQDDTNPNRWHILRARS
ncbi:hypothetical protein OG235_24665 [Streptomyces sp. NBC_00024]|uniref:hypothetical protein n=1 Tax=Streptomyces sp. NBC_00024 TaxID=2903612 RepID=UPI003247E55B